MQFLDQSEEDMKLAWEVFDVGRNGELVAGDFRKALLLMGEDVSEGKVARCPTKWVVVTLVLAGG